jgi:hypothetical protein
MKIFLTILIIAVFAFLGIQGYRRVTQSREEYALKESGQAPATPSEVVNPRSLTGLPSELEPELDKAMAAGPAMFKQWISAWQPRIADPRLAWIQLDYCEKIAFSNPTEARALFKQIKARVPVNSPVFPRIRKLEPTLE